MTLFRSKSLLPFWIAMILFSASGFVASQHVCHCPPTSCSVSDHGCDCHEAKGLHQSCAHCEDQVILIKPALVFVAHATATSLLQPLKSIELDESVIVVEHIETTGFPFLPERVYGLSNAPPRYILFHAQRLSDADNPSLLLA